MIVLALPLPPTANNCYPTVGKRRVLSSEAKRFRLAVLYEVMRRPRQPQLSGRLALEVSFCFPTNARTDLDNRIKPLQDALQEAGVFADDCQFDRLVVTRGEPTKPGSCAVLVREL